MFLKHDKYDFGCTEMQGSNMPMLRSVPRLFSH